MDDHIFRIVKRTNKSSIEVSMAISLNLLSFVEANMSRMQAFMAQMSLSLITGNEGRIPELLQWCIGIYRQRCLFRFDDAKCLEAVSRTWMWIDAQKHVDHLPI